MLAVKHYFDYSLLYKVQPLEHAWPSVMDKSKVKQPDSKTSPVCRDIYYYATSCPLDAIFIGEDCPLTTIDFMSRYCTT